MGTLFVRDPVAWRIHSEVILLLGWERAILLQFAHPLIACGIADHSSFHRYPYELWRRLARTLDAMVTLTFGTDEEVARVVRSINAIHDRVYGQLPEPASVFPRGAQYSARDPSLLRWVHATFIDSSLRTYELYVGCLAQEEKDRYCVEASGIEPLLGLPEGSLPRSVAELECYVEEMLESGKLMVTETAKLLARELVTPSLPLGAWPLVWLVQLPTIGLLPPSIREAYGFSWDSRRETALRLSAKLIRMMLPMAPHVVRYWPAARTAVRRRPPRLSDSA